jgi:hypothetical protein
VSCSGAVVLSNATQRDIFQYLLNYVTIMIMIIVMIIIIQLIIIIIIPCI